MSDKILVSKRLFLNLGTPDQPMATVLPITDCDLKVAIHGASGVPVGQGIEFEGSAVEVWEAPELDVYLIGPHIFMPLAKGLKNASEALLKGLVYLNERQKLIQEEKLPPGWLMINKGDRIVCHRVCDGFELLVERGVPENIVYQSMRAIEEVKRLDSGQVN